jgi:hypothetical protein
MSAVLHYPTIEDNFTTTTLIESKAFTDNNGLFTATFNNLPNEVANGLELFLEFVVPGVAGVNISQVQLEEGEVATPFEQRPISLELSLCQRYYEKNTAPLTHTATAGRYFVYYKTTKRKNPIIQYTLLGGTGGTVSATYSGVDHLAIDQSAAAGDFDFTADAEL